MDKQVDFNEYLLSSRGTWESEERLSTLNACAVASYSYMLLKEQIKEEDITDIVWQKEHAKGSGQHYKKKSSGGKILEELNSLLYEGENKNSPSQRAAKKILKKVKTAEKRKEKKKKGVGKTKAAEHSFTHKMSPVEEVIPNIVLQKEVAKDSDQHDKMKCLKDLSVEELYSLLFGERKTNSPSQHAAKDIPKVKAGEKRKEEKKRLRTSKSAVYPTTIKTSDISDDHQRHCRLRKRRILLRDAFPQVKEEPVSSENSEDEMNSQLQSCHNNPTSNLQNTLEPSLAELRLLVLENSRKLDAIINILI